MRWSAVGCTLLVACAARVGPEGSAPSEAMSGSSPDSVADSPSAGDSPSAPDSSSAGDLPSALVPTAMARNGADAPWDPGTPLDPALLRTRRMFVVAAQSAVCPTREQALARQCGHSVEDVTQGTREAQGEFVVVVGDAPLQGVWRSLRYQKAGILPAWIAADDVAAQPKHDFLDAWDARADVATALDATQFDRAKIGKTKAGTLLKWAHTRRVREGEMGDTVLVYVGSGADAVAAVELPPPSRDDSFVLHHECLLGECRELAYVCDDTYCDEVSLLARATRRRVPLPGAEDPKAGTIPLLVAVALSDRFGTFPRLAAP
jgi:hypothetical protein